MNEQFATESNIMFASDIQQYGMLVVLHIHLYVRIYAVQQYSSSSSLAYGSYSLTIASFKTIAHSSRSSSSGEA
jgi:hypothetical protein